MNVTTFRVKCVDGTSVLLNSLAIAAAKECDAASCWVHTMAPGHSYLVALSLDLFESRWDSVLDARS